MVGIDAIGIDAIGIEAIGEPATAIDAIGIEAIGEPATAIEAIGIEAIGIDAIGIDAIGIDAIGIDAIGAPSMPIEAIVAAHARAVAEHAAAARESRGGECAAPVGEVLGARVAEQRQVGQPQRAERDRRDRDRGDRARGQADVLQCQPGEHLRGLAEDVCERRHLQQRPGERRPLQAHVPSPPRRAQRDRRQGDTADRRRAGRA